MGCFRRASAAAAILAVLVLIGATAQACHGLQPYPNPPPAGDIPDYNHGEDFGLRLYLKAENGKGYLSTDPQAPSQPSMSRGDSTSGIVTGLDVVQGKPSTDFMEFETREPLSDTLWLNLSKPIVGVLRISSTGQQSTGNREALALRFQVFLGETYIGGDDCFQSGSTAWTNGPLKMHPETDKLDAGKKIKVRVLRHGGLSDLQIGTAAPQQSFLEFRVTAYDLAASAVFLQNHRLYFGGEAPSQSSSPTPEGEGPSEKGGSALFVLPLLGLAAIPRRRAALVVLLVAFAGLAGCIGGAAPKVTGGPGDSGNPKPTAEQTQAPDPKLEGTKAGSINGYVRTDLGIPVDKAHVSVLGTPNFTATNSKGYFELAWVAAGDYDFRVDKEGFVSLEQAIRVEAGRRLTLEVTLVPPSSKGSNLREHDHGNWGDAKEMHLWTSDFNLQGLSAVGVNDQKIPPDQAIDLCPFYFQCSGPIPLNEQKPVPPGTGMVEVVLSWNKEALPIDQMGLRITNSKFAYGHNGNYYYDEKSLMPRGPNQPFRFYIFPDEADPGHQADTSWTFSVYTAGTGSTTVPWSRTGLMQSVHAEIKAHKGVVVPEPAHQDFWGNLTEKQLLLDHKKTLNCIGCDYPYSLSSSYYWYYFDFKSLIPPGTAEIRGTFRYEQPQGAPVGTSWTLAYKPGTTPYGSNIPREEIKRVPGTVTNQRLDFVIVPTAKELDPFYYTNSGWMFFPDDQQEPIGTTKTSVNVGNGVNLYLSLKIVRDPNYTFS